MPERPSGLGGALAHVAPAVRNHRIPCVRGSPGKFSWWRRRSRSASCVVSSFCITLSNPRAICAVSELARPLLSSSVICRRWRAIRSRLSSTWRSATARCLLASAPLSNNDGRGCCRNFTGPVDCVSLLATAHLQTRATMFPAYEHTVSGSRSLLLMRAVADHFAP
jgi:hypothetical protein